MAALSQERTDPLVMLFLPLHKRAMGTATGIAAALLLFVATAVPLLRGRTHEIGLNLLTAYFQGFDMSWKGAFIGAAWASFMGFVIGWFLAFSSNFVLAIRLITLRARAEYAQTRDFMDHI